VSAGELSPEVTLGVPLRSPRVSASKAAREHYAVPGLSLRSNFAWVLSGNFVFAFCQWGMIVALAKMGSTTMVGQFSLGLAIATPILMFSNFDLRSIQATDSRREYRFSEYLRLRIVMTLAGLLVIAAIAWLGHYERRTAMIILAIGLAKAVETLSDIHYGLFQLNGRLDQTGRSMMLRGIVSVAALGAGLYLSRDVLWGCILLALAWLVVLLFFDIRHGRPLVADGERAIEATHTGAPRRLWRLAGIALPMGLVTAIISLNLHMPRYFIHAHMGDHELGVFSALAYATIAITLVGDSLANCAIPRLSRLYADRRMVAFRSLLLTLLAAGSGLGLAGLALVQGFGKRLLRIFYSPEYAAYSHVFLLLVIAAAIHFSASMLTSGITSARFFRIQVPMYLLVTASTAFGCARWVPSMGLAGGALAVIAGAVVRLLLAALVVRYLLLARSCSGPAWRWLP
jgi:O-antigen/teichoic acid export membrane protein